MAIFYTKCHLDSRVIRNAFALSRVDLAQSFRTGPNLTGYTVSSIDLKLDSADSTNTPTVKLYSGSANGTEEATFAGPTMLDASSIKNYLITTQAKRNLSSRSGIGGVRSAT